MRPSESRAKTEVGELDVSVGVDQDVVRFDVAVNEAHFVDARHGARQLGDVKPKQASVKWLLHENSKLSYLARSSENFPNLMSKVMRSPPGMYSMTK